MTATVTWKQACTVLGLSLDHKPEMVKLAHRRAAFLAHPDSGRGSGASFIAVQNAYERLTKFRDLPDPPATELVVARPAPAPAPPPTVSDLRPEMRPTQARSTTGRVGVDLELTWENTKRIKTRKGTKIIETRGRASLRGGISIDVTTITGDAVFDEDELRRIR
jgi:hypothetical protein